MQRRATAIVGMALALALSGCASQSSGRETPPQVTVSVSRCGQGWAHPVAGQQHFVLDNTDTRAGEVSLIDARTGAVFADVEPIGPGTSTTLDIDLGSGRYAFRCAMEDEPVVTGPTVRIPGHVRGSAVAVEPVTQADLIPATKSYQRYVLGQLPALARLTAVLQHDIAIGDLSAARQDWLPAHMAYARLGAAYGAFGALDEQINGLAHGLPRGVHDPSWAGLHRIEYGLWHGEPAASLVPYAAAVRRAVGSLAREFATAQLDPLDIALRAHEIAEDALQFDLTGDADYGSHSALPTVRAELEGTRTVLGMLESLLKPRYRALPTLDANLARAERDLDALRQQQTWPPLAALGRSARERINADVGQLCELLAPVASILEPRRTS